LAIIIKLDETITWYIHYVIGGGYRRRFPKSYGFHYQGCCHHRYSINNDIGDRDVQRKAGGVIPKQLGETKCFNKIKDSLG
jgi:hypothetical protein